MRQANADIREKIISSGLKFWQVAQAIGISHTTFSVRLRKELPQSEKEKILKAISHLKEEV